MPRHYLKRELISHTRKVCSLFKKMSRDCHYWEDDFMEARFKRLQVRALFDKYKGLQDMREAKEMLKKGEEHLFNNIHPEHAKGQPFHAWSKDGIAYGRNLESPDYVMDEHWPLEKARFPYYFANREKMKDEYIRLWKKKMNLGDGEAPDRS